MTAHIYHDDIYNRKELPSFFNTLDLLFNAIMLGHTRHVLLRVFFKVALFFFGQLNCLITLP